MKCQKLNYHYGEKSVLKDITFSLDSPEIVGLIGPNGSGKSTLLRCLAGELKGNVFIDDKNLSNLSARTLAFKRAYLPQYFPEPAGFTVLEIIAMGQAARETFYHLPKDTAAIETLLQELQCDLKLDQPFEALSGGERQLVLLAQVLNQQTPYLLLDEPFNGLDYKHRLSVLEALQKRCKQGATIVLSVHDVMFAQKICQRLLVLKAGELIANDVPEKIVQKKLLENVYEVPFEFISTI